MKYLMIVIILMTGCFSEIEEYDQYTSCCTHCEEGFSPCGGAGDDPAMACVRSEDAWSQECNCNGNRIGCACYADDSIRRSGGACVLYDALRK